MFTIPQPPDASAERPIVDVSEDSEALSALLRICYPEPARELPSLDLIHRVLGAALKYEMAAAIVSVKSAMFQPRFTGLHPLQVFVIACRLGLEAEAAIAAQNAVDLDGVKSLLCPGIDDISAGAYYRLLELSRARSQPRKPNHKRAGTQVVPSTPAAPGPFCEPPRHALAVPLQRCSIPSVNAPFDAPDAYLILRSSDSVDFRVARSNIAITSATTLLERATPLELYEDEVRLPIHVMAEDSVVVDTLLRMCCSTIGAPLNDLDVLLDVLPAARKYNLQAVEAMIRHSWPMITKRDPLRLYIHAVRYGWVAEAHMCVRSLLQDHSIPAICTRYLPEFETMGNGPYRRLLFYLEACSQAATADFTLDLKAAPRRYCKPPACQAHYPDKFQIKGSSLSMPMFLYGPIHAIKQALKDRPCGSTLGANTRVARAFLETVVGDTPPCREPGVFGTRTGNPFFQEPCSPTKNLAWAWAVSTLR